MDNLSVPEGFAQVWARVNALSVNELPDTEERELERFIKAEQRSVGVYRKILQRLKEADRRLLLQIIADEKRHLKNLQMEYFLKTGDTCAVLYCENKEAEGLMASLRRSILSEKEASAAYSKAAEGRCEELKSMYRAMAVDEERHSVMLKELLCRCFGESD